MELTLRVIALFSSYWALGAFFMRERTTSFPVLLQDQQLLNVGDLVRDRYDTIPKP
jgi:hypothetical protein